MSIFSYQAPIPLISNNSKKQKRSMDEIDETFYKRQYYKLLDFLPIPIAVSQLVGQEPRFLRFKTHYLNRKYTEVMGWTLEDVPDNQIGHELAYPDPAYRREIEDLIYQLLNTLPHGEQTIQFTSKVSCKEGVERYFETIIEVADSLQPNFYTVAYIDLTPLNTRIEELEDLSQKDSLTNLFNRRAMLMRLEQEQIRMRYTRRPFVVVLVDLDNFKEINDGFGHDCGDYVLKKFAEVFTDNLRGGDYIARWGGDEFFILMTETTLNEAESSLERLRNIWLQEQLIWQGNPLTLTLTLGAAMHESSQTLDETIRQADVALYQGKAQGRNCLVLGK